MLPFLLFQYYNEYFTKYEIEQCLCLLKICIYLNLFKLRNLISFYNIKIYVAKIQLTPTQSIS